MTLATESSTPALCELAVSRVARPTITAEDATGVLRVQRAKQMTGLRRMQEGFPKRWLTCLLFNKG